MRKLNILILFLLCFSTLNAIAQKSSSNNRKPIEIVWEYPTLQDSLIDVKDILLKIGFNTQYEIKDISLLINRLPTETGNRKSSHVRGSHPGYDGLLEQNINLQEGNNNLKIVIRDVKGNVQEAERKVILIPQKDPSLLHRRDYALLFAIDEYDEWGSLTNPINDVQTIAQELQENYGFQVEIVNNFSKDEVMLKLREYSQMSFFKYDQLLIFFAGHGEFDRVFGDGYIVCSDSYKIDDTKMSYIAHSDLRWTINMIPSYHTLLVMDVCFGGAFDPEIAKSYTRGDTDLYAEISTNDFIERKLKLTTRKYLTSGSLEYISDGVPGRHSPFASKFLEALRSKGGRDNIITLPEMYSWLESLSPEPRLGSFGNDQPGSNFMFLYGSQKSSK